MKKRLCSLLLVLCMVLGMLPMSALAAEDVTVPEGWYKVTVKVAPTEANVKFYSDSDATVEITENVYDDGIVGGYHQYTFVVPEGTYSYRAWEGDQFLGGMEFKVPIADEYASDGTLMGKGQVLTLKRVNYVTTHEAIANVGDYTLHLYPQDLREAIIGTYYVNDNKNVVAPVMVNAAGNATTYQGIIDINGELGNTYAVAVLANLTFSPGTSVETRNFVVEEASYYTITAPAEAVVKVFRQNNNYNVIEISLSHTEPLVDGMVKRYFSIPGGQEITYRVSMAGKVTRAGYFSSSYKNLIFEFDESENPKSTRTTAKRIENSSILNINTQNNLKMAVGETFRLRSFRAGWQIINTDPGNIMIEPDFHYNIISGGEHIELLPVTDKCTGNAGSGLNANWIDIKALSAGTAIIEVSYDAIQIGGDTGYQGTFGAVNPSRKSVVVINIGSTKTESSLVVTPAHGNHRVYNWDADMDTVYFLGDSAEFNFTTNMSGTVELSTNLGGSWTLVNQNEQGVYEAKGLVAGNNLLRVTNGGMVQYQVVRASKLKVNIANMTRNSDALIAGDEICVVFEGIYTPVPKMSGIYNPGWTAAHRTEYIVPEGVTASSTSSQYGFAADNKYTLVFTEAGTYTFTGGYITSNVMGDPVGSHRQLTDAGRGVNMNARDAGTNRSIMPELTFEVIALPEITVSVESNPEGATIEITDKNGTVISPNEDGTYSLDYGTYSYKATLNGYVPENGEFEVGGDDHLTGEKTVTIPMRKIEGAIWDGKSSTEPATDATGAYLIGTGAELKWYASFGTTKNAILTADISLGGFSMTISNFKRTFDGNGHYITDLYGASLFKNPKANAVIKNLGVSGHITGLGGIVSHSGDAILFTVQNCVFRGSVNGKQYVGGIVGNADSSSGSNLPQIINCYNAGTIVGGTDGGSGYTGGIAGYEEAQPNTYIKNCYNIGRTSNYGIAKNGRGTNRNNYTLLGMAPNPGGTELGADVLRTYAENLGDAYMNNPTSYNDGYPILKWEEPRALAVALEEFPVELERYEDGEGFTELAAEKLETAIKDGKQAIAAATTLSEAKAALDQAKAIIDAIDPDETGNVVLSGDANGDGSVNIFDLVLLRKYLVDNSNEISVENVDLYEDNQVNIFDLVALRKMLVAE